jgi:hypothetical protein
MRINYHLTALLLFLLSFATGIVMAEDKLASWSLKGFGTFAATGTDNKNIGFYRDRTQSQNAGGQWSLISDSRLGIQVDWKATDSLSATVQWVARDISGNFFEQNLDQAFLRWRIQEDLDIRLGRLAANIFLLSDYRNVGYAYPWMRPPHEVYSGIPYHHVDGIDITKKFAVADGYLKARLWGARAFNPLSSNSLSLQGIYNMSSAIVGTGLRYEDDKWQLNLTYTFVNLTSELPAQDISNSLMNPLLAQTWSGTVPITSLINMKGKEFHYVGIGAAYDDGVWQLHSEASYTNSHALLYPSQFNAYLSVGRRFESVTLYSLYGISRDLSHEVKVPSTLLVAAPALLGNQQQLSGLLNNNGLNEQSISVGARWDFYEKMALKAQWSHYWLDPNKLGVQQWQPNTSNPPNNVNVMSIGIDFMF